MWRGLLLDPLLSLFGQSGGRHFKLQLDEVRVVITWLRSSIPVVCTCVRVFLTWISFRRIEQYGFCFAYKQWSSRSFGFHVIFCCHGLSVLEHIDGINTAISAVAVSAVCQWISQPQWRISTVAVSVSGERRSCPLCWKESVCSLYLPFLSAFPSERSHRYCCCAFPLCPVCDVWPHSLAPVSLSFLDLFLFAVRLFPSSSLLLLKLLRLPLQ